MGVQGWTFLIVGLTFALYIVVAILSRARSTGEFYVAGKGVSPIANGMGIMTPKTSKERSMKRDTPRMLSMVIEPRKRPASTRNTRSRRACSAEASMGCRDAMARAYSVPGCR